MKVKFNEAGPRPPTDVLKVECLLSLSCFSLSWLHSYPDSPLLDPGGCLSQISNPSKKNLFFSGPSPISKTEADIPSSDQSLWVGGIKCTGWPSLDHLPAPGAQVGWSSLTPAFELRGVMAIKCSK